MEIREAVYRLPGLTEKSIPCALQAYSDLLLKYERGELGCDPGRSYLEIAKIDLAEVVLGELGYPLSPTSPTFAAATSVTTYRKESIPPELRWEVWERDNFTCLECGLRRNLSVDHILAESKGGTLDLSNLRTLCRPCNSRKGAR